MGTHGRATLRCPGSSCTLLGSWRRSASLDPRRWPRLRASASTTSRTRGSEEEIKKGDQTFTAAWCGTWRRRLGRLRPLAGGSFHSSAFPRPFSVALADSYSCAGRLVGLLTSRRRGRSLLSGDGEGREAPCGWLRPS